MFSHRPFLSPPLSSSPPRMSSPFPIASYGHYYAGASDSPLGKGRSQQVSLSAFRVISSPHPYFVIAPHNYLTEAKFWQLKVRLFIKSLSKIMMINLPTVTLSTKVNLPRQLKCDVPVSKIFPCTQHS